MLQKPETNQHIAFLRSVMEIMRKYWGDNIGQALESANLSDFFFCFVKYQSVYCREMQQCLCYDLLKCKYHACTMVSWKKNKFIHFCSTLLCCDITTYVYDIIFWKWHKSCFDHMVSLVLSFSSCLQLYWPHPNLSKTFNSVMGTSNNVTLIDYKL